MFNPIEMFQAQGGAGMQAMAQQFGLTPDQAARALEALMPALTLGLQRGAGLDPAGFARMFGLPDAARAAAPQGLDALGQMFGSAQLMQAVLQQASTTSGVGAQVLRQMLPMMAGAVVASIVHVLLNQPQADPARPPAQPAAPLPFGPVWAEMARAFMPAGEPQQAGTPPTRARPATPQPAAPPQPNAEPAGSDMLQQMFRTGAEVQGQNIKAMQALFAAFWPSPGSAGEPGTAPAQDAPAPDERPVPKPRRGRPERGRRPLTHADVIPSRPCAAGGRRPGAGPRASPPANGDATMTDHLTAWDACAETVAGNGVAKRTIPGAGASLVRVVVPAGISAPRHSHDHEQFVQVVSGSGTLETEQGRRPFSAGSVFHFPPGAWHAAAFETETVLIETNVSD